MPNKQLSRWEGTLFWHLQSPVEDGAHWSLCSLQRETISGPLPRGERESMVPALRCSSHNPRSLSVCPARHSCPLAQPLVQDQQTCWLTVSPLGSPVPCSRPVLRAITWNLNMAENPAELLWFEASEQDLTLHQACWVSGAKTVQCAHSYFLPHISLSRTASQIRIVGIMTPFWRWTRERTRDLEEHKPKH